MLLLCHGGKCCGVKHIYGFDTPPGLHLSAYSSTCNGSNSASGQSSNAGKEFFRGKAPVETAVERLDRYLDFCKQKQPKGLIEVTLVYYQKKAWEKTLIKRGFKLVNEFVNSNTDSRIWVYHKVNVNIL